MKGVEGGRCSRQNMRPVKRTCGSKELDTAVHRRKSVWLELNEGRDNAVTWKGWHGSDWKFEETE